MISEWYKVWFETDEYLNVYSHRNENDAENLINLILSNVIISKEANVLDMACGTGRHSLLLAKKGYNVTAVDLSKKLLSIASSKALSNRVKINFIRSDLRNLDLNLRFDLVVNLFTSFGYFENDEENFRIFKNAFKHLNEKGYFVIDFFNKNFLTENLIFESSDRIGNAEILQERKIVNQRVVKEIQIKNNGQTKIFFESVKMYDKYQLLNILTNIGFSVKNIFGDYSGSNFNEMLSPRLIIIAQK